MKRNILFLLLGMIVLLGASCETWPEKKYYGTTLDVLFSLTSGTDMVGDNYYYLNIHNNGKDLYNCSLLSENLEKMKIKKNFGSWEEYGTSTFAHAVDLHLMDTSDYSQFNGRSLKRVDLSCSEGAETFDLTK